MTDPEVKEAKALPPEKRCCRQILMVLLYFGVVAVFLVSLHLLLNWLPRPRNLCDFNGRSLFFWGCLAGFLFFVARIFRSMGTRTVEIFVVLIIVGFLIILLRPNCSSIDYHSHCLHNLQNIGKGLQAYHDQYGHFPPTVIRGENGKPWHSWRGLLAGEQKNDKCCDFSCYVARWASNLEGPKKKLRFTTYVAVQGDDAVWRADGSPRSLEKIADPANTAMVIELADSKIQEFEPKDILLDDLVSDRIAWDRVAVHKYDDGLVYPQTSTNILFADGSVRRCIGVPTQEEIRQLFSIKEKPVTRANRRDKENYVFGDRGQVLAKQPVRAIVYYAWWTSLVLLFIAAIWPRRRSREQ